MRLCQAKVGDDEFVVKKTKTCYRLDEGTVAHDIDEDDENVHGFVFADGDAYNEDGEDN